MVRAVNFQYSDAPGARVAKKWVRLVVASQLLVSYMALASVIPDTSQPSSLSNLIHDKYNEIFLPNTDTFRYGSHTIYITMIQIRYMHITI